MHNFGNSKNVVYTLYVNKLANIFHRTFYDLDIYVKHTTRTNMNIVKKL